MTKEKYAQVLTRYVLKLSDLHCHETKQWPSGSRAYVHHAWILPHLAWMVREMHLFLESDRMEKLNRWLGFVQGVFWIRGDYTLDELKEHNRPDEVAP